MSHCIDTFWRDMNTSPEAAAIKAKQIRLQDNVAFGTDNFNMVCDVFSRRYRIPLVVISFSPATKKLEYHYHNPVNKPRAKAVTLLKVVPGGLFPLMPVITCILLYSCYIFVALLS
jgi:hypothetical protein